MFTVPVATADSEQVLTWLRRQGIQLAVTHLETSHPHYLTDFKKPTAIVMGAEASGISPFWVEAADERVIIPMQGRVDSLNVSASTAVLLFEAETAARAVCNIESSGCKPLACRFVYFGVFY